MQCFPSIIMVKKHVFSKFKLVSSRFSWFLLYSKNMPVCGLGVQNDHYVWMSMWMWLASIPGCTQCSLGRLRIRCNPGLDKAIAEDQLINEWVQFFVTVCSAKQEAENLFGKFEFAGKRSFKITTLF